MAGSIGIGNSLIRGESPAGPPFVATSAANGVSVDPVTGKIVLGDQTGGVLSTLLNNRVIPMATFSLQLLYPTVGQSFTFQPDGNLDLLSAFITNPAKTRGFNMEFTLPGTTATGLRLKNNSSSGGIEIDIVNDAGRGTFIDVLGTTMAGGDITRFQTTGNEMRYAALGSAFFRWFTGVTQRMALLNNGRLRIAANNTDNTALLQVAGTISGDRLVFPRNLTPYSVDASQDRGNFFTNEGASALIVFNLPTAVLNTTTGGYRYTFYVQDVDGLQVVAAAGDTIRVGTSVSAAAGNIQSTNIGSCITLQCINATEWVAQSVIGSWTVT